MATNYTQQLEKALRAFYAKHDLPLVPNQTNLYFHLGLIAEEAGELAQAINKRKAHKHVSKELADLLYVVVGTALVAEVDLNEAFRAVHEANMAKSFSKWDQANGATTNDK